MGGSYGRTDRPLSASLAARVIGDQFPQLRGLEVRPFGAGWDYELFTVGGGRIFRFPKRARARAVAPARDRDDADRGRRARADGARFDWVGQPGDWFPYPFTGYRMMPGAAADQAPLTDPGGLAADLGRMLGRLHRIDPALSPPTPDDWEHEPGAEITAELVDVADSVRPLLAGDLLARAAPYLAGDVPAPPAAGPASGLWPQAGRPGWPGRTRSAA